MTFDLYGSSVEPFDDTKTKAVQMAIAQSAGKWCQRLQPLAVCQAEFNLIHADTRVTCTYNSNVSD